MMRRLAFVLLLLPLDGAALQALPTPRDFAYGVPLEVDGDGALYRFELPDEVYRYSTRRDLGDLRIFNGYNEVVPHLLRPGVAQGEAIRQPVSLRFFPLYEAADSGGADTQIHIATDSSGAVVDFWQRGPLEAEREVRRYLIDASALEHPAQRLLLAWDDAAEDVLVSLTLEYSDDLNRWHSLGTSATLAALRYNGHRLGQREIELPALEAKYYRISWPLGRRGIALRSVRAEVLREGEEPARRWITLAPSAEETRRGSYEFHAAGHFPIDRLRVLLPQDNTVVQAKIFSRAGGEAQWQVRHRGLFYRLQHEGHTLQNDTITLPVISDPYWRLELDMEGGGAGRGEPKLELGWVAHELFFVTRGETPFSLAFAAAEVEPPQSDLAPLLQALKKREKGVGFIKSAIPGSYFELGGERRLRPEPPPPPWEKWLLWAVLVLGALTLALMARSLYRQMNATDRID